MTKQIKHLRKSCNGKLFAAGSRKSSLFEDDSKPEFRLVSKDYKSEVYKSEKHGVVYEVSMDYHTFRKWWDVGAKYLYNHREYEPGKWHWYGSSGFFKGKEFIKSRKDARAIAQQYMNEAKWNDVKKLDKFHQEIMNDASN